MCGGQTLNLYLYLGCPDSAFYPPWDGKMSTSQRAVMLIDQGWRHWWERYWNLAMLDFGDRPPRSQAADGTTAFERVRWREWERYITPLNSSYLHQQFEERLPAKVGSTCPHSVLPQGDAPRDFPFYQITSSYYVTLQKSSWIAWCWPFVVRFHHDRDYCRTLRHFPH